MDLADSAGRAFALKHFAAVDLGDQRRTQRLLATVTRIIEHPSGSLPQKMQSPAALKGLYRLAQNERVTHESVLAPHRRLTLERMREEDVVLVIHDATELDFTGKKSLKNLGQLGNGSQRGYLCHQSLAVVPETREVLGLAQQTLYCRPEVPADESRDAKRQRQNRESRLWQQGCEKIGLAPPGKLWVDVADRGADLFEFLDYEHRNGRSYVVRSLHNRQIAAEEPQVEQAGGPCRLHDSARALPDLGRKTVSVPARQGQPAREAVVRVAAAAVRLLPPQHPRGEHGNEPLATWVVHVREVDPPAGVEPLEWLLLTNVAVEHFEHACQRVEWYARRWIIEEYHKCQKTGCDIQSPQFEYEARLQPVLAILSVVALWLLQLRDAGRAPDAESRPAREIVPQSHVEVLSAWRFQTVCDLSVKQFLYALARLGGHQNRKRDGNPGWLTLWRGWTKLDLMVQGARALLVARERSG